MKDSRVARRDDDSPVVFVRSYRRANEVASPVSMWGCGSWSRSVNPHHLVLVVPLLLLVLLLFLLLLLWLLLLLLLRVVSSVVRGILDLLLPPQVVLLLKKWDVKKSVISY
jgi:hypothetical protein